MLRVFRCVIWPSIPHLFYAMKKHTSDPRIADLKKQIEANEAKLVEYAHDALRWRENRDDITESFRKLTVTALTKGDASRLRQVAQDYTEIQFKSYSTFKTVLDESNKERLSLHEAIGIFPSVYDLLELVPEEALLHPVFGKMLLALREGRSDRNVGSVCQKLLEAIAQKIAEPPRKLDELALTMLLEHYEVVHKGVRKIWYSVLPHRRYDKILQKSSLLRKLLDRNRFVGRFQPDFISYNLLAWFKGTNVNDLKKDLVKARKIRRALKAIDMEILPPIGFAELLMFGGDTIADRTLRETLDNLFRGVPAETLAKTFKGYES